MPQNGSSNYAFTPQPKKFQLGKGMAMSFSERPSRNVRNSTAFARESFSETPSYRPGSSNTVSLMDEFRVAAALNFGEGGKRRNRSHLAEEMKALRRRHLKSEPSNSAATTEALATSQRKLEALEAQIRALREELNAEKQTRKRAERGERELQAEATRATEIATIRTRECAELTEYVEELRAVANAEHQKSHEYRLQLQGYDFLREENGRYLKAKEWREGGGAERAAAIMCRAFSRSHVRAMRDTLVRWKAFATTQSRTNQAYADVCKAKEQLRTTHTRVRQVMKRISTTTSRAVISAYRRKSLGIVFYQWRRKQQERENNRLAAEAYAASAHRFELSRLRLTAWSRWRAAYLSRCFVLPSSPGERPTGYYLEANKRGAATMKSKLRMRIMGMNKPRLSAPAGLPFTPPSLLLPRRFRQDRRRAGAAALLPMPGDEYAGEFATGLVLLSGLIQSQRVKHLARSLAKWRRVVNAQELEDTSKALIESSNTSNYLAEMLRDIKSKYRNLRDTARGLAVTIRDKEEILQKSSSYWRHQSMKSRTFRRWSKLADAHVLRKRARATALRAVATRSYKQIMAKWVNRWRGEIQSDSNREEREKMKRGYERKIRKMRRASVVIQQSLESEKDSQLAEERRRHEADKERLIEEKRQEIIRIESHHKDLVEKAQADLSQRAQEMHVSRRGLEAKLKRYSILLHTATSSWLEASEKSAFFRAWQKFTAQQRFQAERDALRNEAQETLKERAMELESHVRSEESLQIKLSRMGALMQKASSAWMQKSQKANLFLAWRRYTSIARHDAEKRRLKLKQSLSRIVEGVWRQKVLITLGLWARRTRSKSRAIWEARQRDTLRTKLLSRTIRGHRRRVLYAALRKWEAEASRSKVVEFKNRMTQKGTMQSFKAMAAISQMRNQKYVNRVMNAWRMYAKQERERRILTSVGNTWRRLSNPPAAERPFRYWLVFTRNQRKTLRQKLASFARFQRKLLGVRSLSSWRLLTAHRLHHRSVVRQTSTGGGAENKEENFPNFAAYPSMWHYVRDPPFPRSLESKNDKSGQDAEAAFKLLAAERKAFESKTEEMLKRIAALAEEARSARSEARRRGQGLLALESQMKEEREVAWARLRVRCQAHADTIRALRLARKSSRKIDSGEGGNAGRGRTTSALGLTILASHLRLRRAKIVCMATTRWRLCAQHRRQQQQVPYIRSPSAGPSMPSAQIHLDAAEGGTQSKQNKDKNVTMKLSFKDVSSPPPQLYTGGHQRTGVTKLEPSIDDRYSGDNGEDYVKRKQQRYEPSTKENELRAEIDQLQGENARLSFELAVASPLSAAITKFGRGGRGRGEERSAKEKHKGRNQPTITTSSSGQKQREHRFSSPPPQQTPDLRRLRRHPDGKDDFTSPSSLDAAMRVVAAASTSPPRSEFSLRRSGRNRGETANAFVTRLRNHRRARGNNSGAYT